MNRLGQVVVKTHVDELMIKYEQPILAASQLHPEWRMVFLRDLIVSLLRPTEEGRQEIPWLYVTRERAENDCLACSI